METQSKMFLSLSKEKLWDLFGKHSVFSESPNTLFNCFELWSHGEGVFCYRLKPNLEETLLSEEYEERTKDDVVKNELFKNIQLVDNYEIFVSPELNPEDYELGDVLVTYTHHQDGEKCETLDRWGTIPRDMWEKEHNKPGFRAIVDEYMSKKLEWLRRLYPGH